MLKKIFVITALFLTACSGGGLTSDEVSLPSYWTVENGEAETITNLADLKGWWRHFNDPTLNALVDLTLQGSPDRLAAEARIEEARGIKRSARSSLFPQLNASGEYGRQETGFDGPDHIDEFYDAGFDASYEIDIFGKNRNNFEASRAGLAEAEAYYHDVSLSLIAEVARTYIDFREAQSQYRIAEKNTVSQQKTLELVTNLYELGASPKLDVERSRALVSSTKASLSEFERQQENARLRLTILTGVLPEELHPLLQNEAGIPGVDLKPVLLAPAKVITLRPDIRAASANLAENTNLAESVTAELFPTFTLSGFYGVSDGSFVTNATVWNVALGAAVALLDFGRIEGRIDAARARERQAFELYRKTVLEAVVDVETALNDHAKLRDQRIELENAYIASENSTDISQTLFKEGEISFIDLLDTQRNLNSAESTLLSAEANQAESIVRIYKSLGVY